MSSFFSSYLTADTEMVEQNWGSNATMAKPWLLPFMTSIAQEAKRVLLFEILCFRRNRASTFNSSKIKTHLQMTQGDCSK